MRTDDNSKLILEIWDCFKEHVGDKKKQEVLFGFFHVLEDYGIFIEDQKELRGEDKWIDTALADYLEEEEPEDDLDGDEELEDY